VSVYVPFILIALTVVGLVIWRVVVRQMTAQSYRSAFGQINHRPCPDQTRWLEEIVTGIEQVPGYRFEVRDPKRWSAEPTIYSYRKLRHRSSDEEVVAEEEILFPLKRSSEAGLVLTLKPSTLAPGAATRLIGAVATGGWDAQPNDLQRLELSPELRERNVIAALGPPGQSVHDLVDPSVLEVVQDFGDVGGLFVRFRDGWCSVASASSHIPFRRVELIARIRQLLQESA
jgi:hypothetical protein